MKIDRMKNKRGQPCAAIHGIHGEEKLRLPARTIRLSLSLSHSVCVCVWVLGRCVEGSGGGSAGPSEIGLKGVKRRGITGHERRREERTE